MRQQDYINHFVIENSEVRGLIVQLDKTWQTARQRCEYPAVIEKVLGEAFAAAVLMSACIKFDGKLTLQVRGTGPVHLLVVQVTRDGAARGLARWESVPEDATLQGVFGIDARMSVSVEADAMGQPHQGIVELLGDSLSDALRNYFKNSEQLLTEFYLHVSDDTAAGLLLQRLPGTASDEDGWDRALALAATVEADELLSLDAETIVYRLYNQESVRLLDKRDICFKCSCSRERTSGVIQGLGAEEAFEILQEQGEISITCEFCAAQYSYDSVDLGTLFSGSAATENPQTRH